MTQDHNYGVVLVTASSQTEAEAIANILITEKLAACINLIPITSLYTWQDQLCKDQEFQLLIKTDLSKFAELEAKIKEHHSYEVPEIIAIPIIKASQSYLSWLNQVIT